MAKVNTKRAHLGLSLAGREKSVSAGFGGALFEPPPCISSVKQTHKVQTGVQRAPSPLVALFWYFSLAKERKVHNKQFDKPKFETERS